jgi:hypothetical protein
MLQVLLHLKCYAMTFKWCDLCSLINLFILWFICSLINWNYKLWNCIFFLIC